jgi:hypothetical protein
MTCICMTVSSSTRMICSIHFERFICYLFPACLDCYIYMLLYDWWFTANQFVLATSSLRLTSTNSIFQLNACGYSLYVTSSLTRGWVCRLQLLLVLASAVIIRSESSRTHDHILLSQIRDSPNLEGHVPAFISPRNKVAFHIFCNMTPEIRNIESE